MDSSLGYFESIGDLLNNSPHREERFWSDIRMTGFQELDKSLGGFRAGELVVVGSQFDWLIPGIFLQMIETVAITEQRPVLHIRVGRNLRTLVGSWLKRTGADPEWRESCKNAAQPDSEKVSELSGAPLYVLDAHGYSCQNLFNAIDSCAKSIKPLGMIVIDGLEHLNIWTGIPETSLPARWADVSYELKFLASRHQCPVIVDSRINSCEPDGTKIEMPKLQHFPHGSAIASSADHVLVLEAVNGVMTGEPASLYSAYSHTGLECHWMQLRYEHDSDRWVEVIER